MADDLNGWPTRPDCTACGGTGRIELPSGRRAWCGDCRSTITPPHRRCPAVYREDAPAGICRWCGEPLLDADGKPLSGRIKWHQACTTEFQTLWWAQVTRSALCEERGARCEQCGAHVCDPLKPYHSEHRSCSAEEIEALRREYDVTVYDCFPPDADGRQKVCISGHTAHGDHIVPLVDAPDRNIRWWTLENLQLLCEPCHKAKTAREATYRAARSRAAVQPKLPVVDEEGR